MNELEQMKELWKDIHQNQGTYSQLNKEQIMENLSKKSNTVFIKLQRSVRLEFIVSAVCLPIILGGTFYYQNTDLKFASSIFCVMGILLTVILWKDFRKIQHYNSDLTTLKQTINDAVLQMDNFVKLYFKVYMFLWPMVGVVYYFMFNYFAKIDKIDIGVLLGFVIFSTVAGYFTQKWYTEKMYGKYLKELQKLKAELEKDEL